MSESTSSAQGIPASPQVPPPVPVPSDLTRPYWDAVQCGELRVQRCETCRTFVHPPRHECPSCAANGLSFEKVSGCATLETFSVVHRTFAPGFADRVPYVIAWVVLDEQPGLRVFTTIPGVDPGELRVDEPMRVAFEHRAGFGDVPVFLPAPDSTEL